MRLQDRSGVDPSRPCIEYYRSQRELQLMVPIFLGLGACSLGDGRCLRQGKSRHPEVCQSGRKRLLVRVRTASLDKSGTYGTSDDVRRH